MQTAFPVTHTQLVVYMDTLMSSVHHQDMVRAFEESTNIEGKVAACLKGLMMSKGRFFVQRHLPSLRTLWNDFVKSCFFDEKRGAYFWTQRIDGDSHCMAHYLDHKHTLERCFDDLDGSEIIQR